MSVTFTDVLKEIDRLNTKSPDGWCASEMAEATGMGIQKCRDYIKRLIAEGAMRYNGMARRQAIDGIWRPVPVYIYIKGAKREK